MKRKLFLRILGVTALSLLLLFIAGLFITYVNGRKLLISRLEMETRLTASLLSNNGDISALESYETDDELRITVVSALTGEVLYESHLDGALENHLQRKEVKYALSGKPQTVTRKSEALGYKMIYYALQSEVGGEKVVVRLAVKDSEPASYFFAALPFLALAFAVAVVVASRFSARQSHSISEKINAVGESLKSLNAGQYIPLQTDAAEQEFYSLFKEINELNEFTHEYIRREKREHERLNAVLANVSQGIVALNANNEIVFVNGSALKLFDNNETVVGRSLVFLLSDAKLCGQIATALAEDAFRFEYELKDKILAVAGKRVLREEPSGELAYLLIFTDVTGEKAIIRQKSDFFANASHELKTPVTVMRGLTEILLSKEGLDEVERKQIERIHKESLRLSSLISDMLKLSKLERNEEDERVEVSLHEIAAEVVAELSEEMQTKELRVDLQGKGRIFASPKQIYELIANLCSNAVNYNKQGGKIAINITQNADKVLLRVEDSGIGIEKEHLPRICERFYRVDKSRSKKTGGTGLGLAIVKHICVLYGAEFAIDSEIGVGTRVSVAFAASEA